MRTHVVIYVSFLVMNSLWGCSNSHSSNASISSTEKNKELARLYFEEVVNKRRLELIKDIYSQDFVFHEMDGKESWHMRDNTLVPHLEYLFKAFPDIHYTIDAILAEGDLVALNTTGRGTHQEEFLGFEATGNKINYKHMFFYRIANGKIVEGWGVVDINGLQEQLKKKQ